MSFRIVLTRGSGPEDPGRGISLAEWQALVERDEDLFLADDGLVLRKNEESRPMIWKDGLVLAQARDEWQLDKLRSLSRALGARLFGEDGAEIGLTDLDDMKIRLRAAYADLDLDLLDSAVYQALIAIDGFDTPAARKEEALAALQSLSPEKGRLALAYLLCRAVECSGDPEPHVLEAVVLLYAHDPERVRSMRGPPMDDFLDAVDERFIQRWKQTKQS